MSQTLAVLEIITKNKSLVKEAEAKAQELKKNFEKKMPNWARAALLHANSELPGKKIKIWDEQGGPYSNADPVHLTVTAINSPSEGSNAIFVIYSTDCPGGRFRPVNMYTRWEIIQQ